MDDACCSYGGAVQRLRYVIILECPKLKNREKLKTRIL